MPEIARQTGRSVEAARFTRQMAGEDTRRSHSDIILNVLRAYFGVTLAEKNLEVEWQSVDSARADLERAESGLPNHGLLHAFFTATSMIGFIAGESERIERRRQ